MGRQLAVIVGVAVLVSVGLRASPDNQTQTRNHVFMQGPLSESQLAKDVRHALLMLPYYSIFDELGFKLSGSVVTLTGACPPGPPWNIKSDAANVVKRLPGVTQVINDIKLLPLSPMIGRSAAPKRAPSMETRKSAIVTAIRLCPPFTSLSTTGM